MASLENCSGRDELLRIIVVSSFRTCAEEIKENPSRIWGSFTWKDVREKEKENKSRLKKQKQIFKKKN